MNAAMSDTRGNRSVRLCAVAAIALSAWVLLWAMPARAQVAVGSTEGSAGLVPASGALSIGPQPLSALRDDMRDYFAREQRGGIVLMAMGAPAAALGASLLFDTPDLWKGMAYPLLILGGAEFIGGLIFAARTPAQVRKLEAGFSTQPRATQAGERKRMQRVNRQFFLIQIVEVALMAGGIAMSAAGGAIKNDALTGVGLGLAIEGTGLLLFDVFAAARAIRFHDSLRRDLILPAGSR